MKSKTILIIEDEPSIAKALAERFLIEGFSVTQASNGEEGLMVALRDHPDLILLDIIMPVMDGITMLIKLRKDIWGKNSKIIILTNLNEQDKISQAIKNGCFDYLVKSDWKLEDLVKKTKNVLDIK